MADIVADVGQATSEIPSMFRHKENALIGGLTGLGVMGASIPLLHAISQHRKKKGKKPLSWGTKIGVSAAIGGGAGLLATALAYGKDVYNGSSFGRGYKIPQKGEYKEGDNPVVQYYIAGSGSGANIWKGEYNRAAGHWGYDKFIIANPHNDIKYVKETMKELAQNYPNAKVRIAGHSHGGPKAKELAEYAGKLGLEVDRLDTIDPIYLLSSAMSGSKPDNIKEWNNYYTTKANWRYLPDLWALLGGRHGKNKHADTNIAMIDGRYNNHTDIMDFPGLESGKKPSEVAQDVMNKNDADNPKYQWNKDVLGTIKSLLGG